MASAIGSQDSLSLYSVLSSNLGKRSASLETGSDLVFELPTTTKAQDPVTVYQDSGQFVQAQVQMQLNQAQNPTGNTENSLLPLKQAFASYTQLNQLSSNVQSVNALLATKPTTTLPRFQVSDTLSYNAEELRGLANLFQRADSDKDTLISKTELERLQKNLKQDNDNGQFDGQLAQLDTLLTSKIENGPSNFELMAGQMGNGKEVFLSGVLQASVSVDPDPALNALAASVTFKPIPLSSNGDKYFTAEDLKALLPLLQKADYNKDGIVNREELQLYKNALLRQKDDLNKMNVARIVMKATQSTGENQATKEKIQKIDTQVKQIDALTVRPLHMEHDLLSQLSTTLGVGDDTLSLQKVTDAITVLCAPS